MLFRSKGSLLSFHPFIQYNNVSNFLLVLNLQDKPSIETKILEIFDSVSLEKLGESELLTNSVSRINLDQFKISPRSLPIMTCKNMAGIPFGLGVSDDNKMLSLEHTHPPASFTLFGNRFKMQSEIKRKWFEKISNV